MKKRLIGLLAALLVSEGAAVEKDLDQVYRDWQLKRLHNPSVMHRQAEQNYSIFIYDGLYDTDVVEAMETQFDRLENMMFIRTVITNEDGTPRVDAETLAVETETDDDDC